MKTVMKSMSGDNPFNPTNWKEVEKPSTQEEIEIRLVQRIDELYRREAALVGLAKVCSHGDDCNSRQTYQKAWGVMEQGECDCGLDAAIAACRKAGVQLPW